MAPATVPTPGASASAGVLRRAAAHLVDLVLLYAVGLPLTYAAGMAVYEVMTAAGASQLAALRGVDTVGYAAVAGWLLLLACCEASPGRAASPGKHLLRLRVVDAADPTRPPTRLRALLRRVALPAAAAATFGLALAPLVVRRRGVHDWLAGTRVVTDPASSRHPTSWLRGHNRLPAPRADVPCPTRTATRRTAASPSTRSGVRRSPGDG